VTEYALLNNVAHQDLKVITERSARYGDDVMYCMTFPFEFRSVQASYPILMQQDSNGSLYPVALLGFQEKENLFLLSAFKIRVKKGKTRRPGCYLSTWLTRG
jgi:hypothetical protein